jgi:two-component system sensor kinase FixL
MELEQTQEALRRSEELYRYIIDLSSLLPWTADREGRILWASARWAVWTGRSTESALGTGWENFVHPDDLDRITAAWRHAVETGDRFDGEWRVRTDDGGYRWMHARAAKRTDGHDGDIVWYGTLDDIHERKMALDSYHRAQAQLARFSRLSAMGAMATAIGHDLNQPLTAIVHYLRGCKRLLADVEGEGKAALGDALHDADRSAVRASDIVRRVRDFVTRGAIETRREDLAELIGEAAQFALTDTPALGITCEIDAEPDCFVMADRVQVQQVLVNLIQNAVEAMQDQPRRCLVIRTACARNGACQIAIEDSGQGIPAEIGNRVFDPLYTTRSGGMGVGLAISRTIVEAHGGQIWHEPAPGGGTIVSFTLPRASAASNPS